MASRCASQGQLRSDTASQNGWVGWGLWAPQPPPLPWAAAPSSACPGPPSTAPPGMGIPSNLHCLSSNTQRSHRQTEERLSLGSIRTGSAWHRTTNHLVIKLHTSHAPWMKPAPFLPSAQTQTAVFDPRTQKGRSASFQGAKVLHVCWVSQSSFQKRGFFFGILPERVLRKQPSSWSSGQSPTHMS